MSEFDPGIPPKEYLEAEAEKKKILAKYANKHNKVDPTNPVMDIPIIPQQEITQPYTQQLYEYDVLLENSILSYDFKIHEYQVLDFAIVCVLGVNSFKLIPKSNQSFDLIIDQHTFPVHYIGKPQFLKSLNVNLLFFLRDLDKDNT